jgi:serine/threonine protein kinase
VNQVSPSIAAKGLSVGEYVLDEKIGQGAFGEVWKAHHRAWLDQLAAVKIPTDPAFLRQLQSEGFSLHRLSHPNIVRVVGFDPAGSPPYLMTELVDGPSLRELLSRGRLSISHAVAILRQILTGLAYAHGRGAVHGDLKPENVLVERSAADDGNWTEPGAVKLTDFGVGLVSAAAIIGKSGSSRLLGSDRAGSVGTLADIAPEQQKGTTPDAKCDLFACGVILFELLTGERPAGAELPSDLNPDVPRALDDVFRKAYARRERRFDSAQEFLGALDASGGSTAPALEVAPEPAPPKEPELKLTPDDSPPIPEDTFAPAIVYSEPEAPAAPAPSPLPEPAEPPPPPPPPPPPRAPRAAPQRTIRSAEANPDAESLPPPRMAARGAVVMDEMTHKPLRTVDDMRALFRRAYLTRVPEGEEVANLLQRLDMWAESEGGVPGFSQRVRVTEIVEAPYHRVSIVTHYEEEDGTATESEGAVLLANPAASQDCVPVLKQEDFTPLIHLSTTVLQPHLLELIHIPVVRMATANLITAAKAQAGNRRIMGQDFKLSRASVMSFRYSYEGQMQGVCFAGATTRAIGPTGPVMRMREETLKRAASLLDSENIMAGTSELRSLLETVGAAQPRAEGMLMALRCKLSAAYMARAKGALGSMGVFESLTYARRAATLWPENPEPFEHEGWLAKPMFWIQTAPGLLIGAIWFLIAYSHKASFFGFAAAALSAALAGPCIGFRLRSRPARTDVAFCHACLLPLLLSGILATALKDMRPVTDVAAGLMVVLTVFLDRWVFIKFGRWLLRPNYQQELAGLPQDLLTQVQAMIEPDWAELWPYYQSLEALSAFAATSSRGAGAPVRQKEELDAPDLNEESPED